MGSRESSRQRSRDEDNGYYDALAGLPKDIGASESYYNGYDDGRETLENVRSYSSDNSDSGYCIQMKVSVYRY